MEEIRTWRIRYKEKNLQELEIVHKFLQKEMEEKRLRRSLRAEICQARHNVNILQSENRALKEDVSELSYARNLERSNGQHDRRLISMERECDARVEKVQEELYAEIERQKVQAQRALDEARSEMREEMRAQLLQQRDTISSRIREDLHHEISRGQEKRKADADRAVAAAASSHKLQLDDALKKAKESFERAMEDQKSRHTLALKTQKDYYEKKVDSIKLHYSALKIQNRMTPWLTKVRARRLSVRNKCDEILKTEEAYVGHLKFVLTEYIQKLRHLFQTESKKLGVEETSGSPSKRVSVVMSAPPGSSPSPPSSPPATKERSDSVSLVSAPPIGLSKSWKDNYAPLTPEEIDTLFGNWEDLVKIHSNFLDDQLRPICEMTGSVEKAVRLSGALVTLAEKLKGPSSEYAAHYESEVLFLLSDLKNSRPLFKKFCDTHLSESCLTLKDILIKPVQRPIHYKLFADKLTRLNNCLPKDSAVLRRATEAIEALCDHTDHVVSKAKVRYLEKMLVRCGNPVRLSVGDRRFVYEGELWKGPVGRRANLRYCYLLSDILIYTERSKLRSSLSRSRVTSRSRASSLRSSFFGSASPDAKAEGSPRRASVSSPLKYRVSIAGILYLRNVTLDEKPGESHFTLSCGEKSWYFEPTRDCNIDLTTGWLDKIKACISECKMQGDDKGLVPCTDPEVPKAKLGIKIYA